MYMYFIIAFSKCENVSTLLSVYTDAINESRVYT